MEQVETYFNDTMMYNKENQSLAYYPQIVEFELLFWNSLGRWSASEQPIKKIRFKALGQSFGKTRWRPHLVLYKDELPEQTAKEFKLMLQQLRQAISKELDVDCMLIAKDLLDNDVKEEDF